jgi:hypothetical protein
MGGIVSDSTGYSRGLNRVQLLISNLREKVAKLGVTLNVSKDNKAQA